MSDHSQSHLSTQFQRLLEGSADLGVELPENMPGMARIGGLHVPVASAQMGLDRNPGGAEEHLSQYDVMRLHIPDEKGNMFQVETYPLDKRRQMSGTGFVGMGDLHADRAKSAEEFADMYVNAEAPSERRKRMYAKEIDRHAVTDRLMGVAPGNVWGYTNTGVSVAQGIHSVFDPRTGEATGAKMSYPEAHSLWMKDWYRRQEQKHGQEDL